MMMRDILFRGKRIDNGEWVFGSLYCDHDLETTAIMECEHSFGMERGEFMEEVDPATIGQYTGLKDKNGQKIFEGDIVEGYDFSEDDGFGLVYWDDGGFWVGNDDWCGTFSNNYNGDRFEVIGNIHDNPELVEREYNDSGKSN